jgi:7,8-dihydropterin-6-yl-methyl-4-(beta-D-ribofuranosyl)aminobenzene 5'-phosphate synthase
MSSITVTFLVDNSVMELVPDKGSATRLSEPGRNFLAEHGFSVLVTTADGTQVLFDTGATTNAVPYNLSLLGLDIERDLDVAVLSHGHSDHCGCVGRLRCPTYAHPDALGYRYLQRNGELRFDLTAHDLLLAKDRLTFEAGPVEVAPNVWTTGQIERTNDWETPKGFLRSEGTQLQPDAILDDQGLALVTETGLVVIAGCAHAGIINTVRQAQQVTGVEDIRAVVGGFHLIDADAEKLERTLKGLRELEAEVLAPLHCTGFHATAALAQAFPGQFVYVTGGHSLSFD